MAAQAHEQHAEACRAGQVQRVARHLRERLLDPLHVTLRCATEVALRAAAAAVDAIVSSPAAPSPGLASTSRFPHKGLQLEVS